MHEIFCGIYFCSLEWVQKYFDDEISRFTVLLHFLPEKLLFIRSVHRKFCIIYSRNYFAGLFICCRKHFTGKIFQCAKYFAVFIFVALSESKNILMMKYPDLLYCYIFLPEKPLFLWSAHRKCSIIYSRNYFAGLFICCRKHFTG